MDEETRQVRNNRDQARLRYGQFWARQERWTDQFYPFCEAPPLQKQVREREGPDDELLDIIRQMRRSYA